MGKHRPQQPRHAGVSGNLANRMANSPSDQNERKLSLDWAKYLGFEEDETEGVQAPSKEAMEEAPAAAAHSPVSSTGSSHAQVGNGQLVTAVKRKASDDALTDLPLKSSRMEGDRMGDTIIINGEIYDRRRRPGSIAELQLLNANASSYMEPSSYSIPEMDAYRSPPSPSVGSTTMEPSNFRMRRRPALAAFGSEVSVSTRLGDSSSMVGGLASPTGLLSLSSPPRVSRPIPLRSQLSDQQLRSLSSIYGSSFATERAHNFTVLPTDFQSECGSSIREPSPDIRIVSPKAKKSTRRRAPPKGTPQAAMGTDETGEPIRISRPPNAWILYRPDQLRIIKNDPVISKKPQADISKLIGALWREEKPEVKFWYEQQAEVKKEEHLRAHPDYRFSPQKKKKAAAAKSTVSTSSGSGSSAAGTTIKIPLTRKQATATHSVASKHTPAPSALHPDMSVFKVMADYQHDDFFQRFLETNQEVLTSEVPLEQLFASGEILPAELTVSTANLGDDFWKNMLDGSHPSSVPSFLPSASLAFSPTTSEDAPSLSMTERTLSSESANWPTPPADSLPLSGIFPSSLTEEYDWSKAMTTEGDDKLFLGTPVEATDFNWDA